MRRAATGAAVEIKSAATQTKTAIAQQQYASQTDILIDALAGLDVNQQQAVIDHIQRLVKLAPEKRAAIMTLANLE